jgi:hypothetical protein
MLHREQIARHIQEKVETGYPDREMFCGFIKSGMFLFCTKKWQVVACLVVKAAG